MEQPQVEEQRVIETTHVEPSTRDGRNRTRKANLLLLDARENVGEPTSQRRQISSPQKYIGYMALMSEGIEIEASSFEESV